MHFFSILQPVFAQMITPCAVQLFIFIRFCLLLALAPKRLVSCSESIFMCHWLQHIPHFLFYQVQDVWSYAIFILLHPAILFDQYHLLKTPEFFDQETMVSSWNPCWISSNLRVCNYFWAANFYSYDLKL